MPVIWHCLRQPSSYPCVARVRAQQHGPRAFSGMRKEMKRAFPWQTARVSRSVTTRARWHPGWAHCCVPNASRPRLPQMSRQVHAGPQHQCWHMLAVRRLAACFTQLPGPCRRCFRSGLSGALSASFGATGTPRILLWVPQVYGSPSTCTWINVES